MYEPYLANTWRRCGVLSSGNSNGARLAEVFTVAPNFLQFFGKNFQVVTGPVVSLGQDVSQRCAGVRARAVELGSAFGGLLVCFDDPGAVGAIA